MKVLWVERDIDWLPKPNEACYVLDDVLPPCDLITAAYGLLFDGNLFLMARLVERGWDVPGGHCKRGETPLETVQREVYEETGVRLATARILGHQKIVIHGAKPPDYRYPHPVSYQVFYWGQVGEIEPFVPTEEVCERGLLRPEQARRIASTKGYRLLYEGALEATSGGGVCAR